MPGVSSALLVESCNDYGESIELKGVSRWQPRAGRGQEKKDDETVMDASTTEVVVQQQRSMLLQRLPADLFEIVLEGLDVGSRVCGLELVSAEARAASRAIGFRGLVEDSASCARTIPKLCVEAFVERLAVPSLSPRIERLRVVPGDTLVTRISLAMARLPGPSLFGSLCALHVSLAHEHAAPLLVSCARPAAERGALRVCHPVRLLGLLVLRSRGRSRVGRPSPLLGGGQQHGRRAHAPG